MLSLTLTFDHLKEDSVQLWLFMKTRLRGDVLHTDTHLAAMHTCDSTETLEEEEEDFYPMLFLVRIRLFSEWKMKHS